MGRRLSLHSGAREIISSSTFVYLSPGGGSSTAGQVDSRGSRDGRPGRRDVTTLFKHEFASRVELTVNFG